MIAVERSWLMDRYLDPGTRLGEVMFGLIMTLTFTLGAGILIEEEGREGAHQLLIAAVGCNLAWGIIDGVLYLVGQLFERGRRRRLQRAVCRASSDRAATPLVAGELDALLAKVTSLAEREALYTLIAVNLRTSPEEIATVRKADFVGAFTSFCLVTLASVPAIIPFLLFDKAHLALRVSNAILLGTLFIAGYWWARYTLSRPWLVGLCFLIGGTALVALAIALGG